MTYKNSYKKKILTLIFLSAMLFAIPAKGFCTGTEPSFGYIESRINQYHAAPDKSITYWKTAEKKLTDNGIAASTEEIALVTHAYLKHYEIFKKQESLKKAKDGLAFLYFMQGDNGCFYDYMKENGEKINKTGSEPAPGEATAHAFYTIAEAARILKDASQNDLSTASKSLSRVFNKIKCIVENPDTGYGKYGNFEKFKIPQWLIMGRGDLSALYLMGLSSWSVACHNAEVSKIACELGQGIMEFKFEDDGFFPKYQLLSFTDAPTEWKTENAFQNAALAYAGSVFSKKDWIVKSRNSAIGFLIHLPLSYGPIEGLNPHPDEFPQTPLAAYTLTTNFMALSKATGDEEYARIAGICASWFFNNNSTGQPVYKAENGSCCREIKESGRSEEKSLTGSACALLSIMSVYNSKGHEMLTCKPESTHTYQVLESDTGKSVHDDISVIEKDYQKDGKGKVSVMKRRNTYWHKFTVQKDDDYFLLMTFQRQMLYSAAVAVNVRLDGGPILLIPLGGSQEKPYMMTQKVTEPAQLSPGYHTIGVRYRGLLFTMPAIVDCVTVQPVLERKQFVNAKGQHFIFVKNWLSQKKRMPLPENLNKTAFSVNSQGMDGQILEEPLKEVKGKKYLFIPRDGFGMLQWQSTAAAH